MTRGARLRRLRLMNACLSVGAVCCMRRGGFAGSKY